MKSMTELAKQIRMDAENGVDFGCECYFCGKSPIGLVERGDAIPMIYGDGKNTKCFCHRCSDEARSTPKDPNFDLLTATRQQECVQVFGRPVTVEVRLDGEKI